MKRYKLRKKEVSGGGPNTIRHTTYAPTAYGFKGGKVLARRAGSGDDIEEQVLFESSVDEEALTHLTHARELHRVAPQHQNKSVDLIRQFHNLRQGKSSTVSASHKFDGGASIIVGHGEVSDKHRAARNVYAKTPKEVDEHFGHAPEYADHLKNILSQSKDLVAKGKRVQGDFLFRKGTRKTTSIGPKVSSKENKIKYEMHTPASVGIAFHHEITHGVAHGISPGTVHGNKNVFVPKHEYTPDPKTYSSEDRKAVEHHLHQAQKLIDQHTTTHLTSSHIGEKNKPGHLHMYVNSTVRNGTEPSVSGYEKHLKERGVTEASRLSTRAGQNRRMAHFDSLVKHVEQNKKHFQRTFDVEHHLNQATEHVLKGISHPDVKPTIDGKHEPAGEGIVLSQKDKQHRLRPMVKLVRRSVSQKLLDPLHKMQRFGK